MELFKNRPLALAGCVLALSALGLWAAGERLRRVAILTGVVLLLFALGCILFGRGLTKWRELVLLCSLALLLGALSSHLYFDRRVGELSDRLSTPATVEGLVISREGSSAYAVKLRVRLTSIDGEAVRGRAILSFSTTTALQSGDLFCATVEPSDGIGGTAASDIYALADGYALSLDGVEGTVQYLGTYERDPEVLLARWNLMLSTLLAERIGGEAGALGAALLLGNRSLLSADTTLQFRRAGISHLLALSGLHASVLIGAMEYLLRRLRIPKRVRAILIPTAALGYLLLTGSSPSIVRAVLLVVVSYLGFLLGENYDPFTALAAALSLMLLTTPYAVLDLSLWMSFLAAAGIVVFLPALTERWEIKGKLRRPPLWVRAWRGFLTALAVGAFANLTILLLSAAAFGSVSLASVPATMLLSFPTEGLLILSVLSLVFPARWFSSITAAVGKLLLLGAGWVSDLTGVLVPATGELLLLLSIATFFAILFAVIRLRHRAWLILPVGLALVGMLLPAVLPLLSQDQPLTADYLCTEEGGQTLLFSNEGDAVVIDFSNGDPSNAVATIRLLEAAECCEVSDLVITHCRRQHTYAIYLLATTVKLRRIYLPMPETPRESALTARLAEEARRHGVEVYYGLEERSFSGVSLLGHRHTRDENEEVVGSFLAFSADGVPIAAINGAFDRAALPREAEETLAAAEVLLVGPKSATREVGWILPRLSPHLLLVASERRLERLPWCNERILLGIGVGVVRFLPASLPPGVALSPIPNTVALPPKTALFRVSKEGCFSYAVITDERKEWRWK